MCSFDMAHLQYHVDALIKDKSRYSSQSFGNGGRLHQKSYLCFLGLVLMSPRTWMSEKSILNLLSSVAILTGHTDQSENAVCSAMQVSSDKEQNQCFFFFFLLRLLDEEIRSKPLWTHARRSWSMRLIFPPMKTRILQSPHLLLLVSRKGISRVRPADTNTHFTEGS